VAVFDWLFEGRPTVYVALGAVAGVLLLLWWQRRKRGLLIGACVVVALAGVYAVLDGAVETDREQIVRKINDMATAISARNLDRAFEHISDHFRSHGGRTKNELRNLAEAHVGRDVTHMEVWDITFDGDVSRQRPPARVSFEAKLRNDDGSNQFLGRCEAVFDFEGEHGWRMREVHVFKPQSTEEWPFGI
jgi:hypothetical protein